METCQCVHSLSRRDNGIMIGNLFVIYIPCLCQVLIQTACQNLFCIWFSCTVIQKSLYIFPDFLCNCRRQDSGIGSWIRNQFLFIKFLNDFQGFIRTDFEESGTFILQFCQIVKKRRIFIFFLFLQLFNHCFKGWIGAENFHQCFCIFFFLKAVFLIQFW